jgi:hypothetical protein
VVWCVSENLFKNISQYLSKIVPNIYLYLNISNTDPITNKMDSRSHHNDSSRHPYRPVAHQPLAAVQEENNTPVDESSLVIYVMKSIYNEIVGYTTFETLYYYIFLQLVYI